MQLRTLLKRCADFDGVRARVRARAKTRNHLPLGFVAGTISLALAALVWAIGVPVLAQQAEQPGQPIIIRWSTETEVNTAGYNIYRAESTEGPWQKINERLIPGSTDPLRGGSYVFTDTNVIVGATYWYELEEVELSGNATRLQRTQAVAQPLRRSPAETLPCGAALLPIIAIGVVLGQRRRAL